MTKEKGHRTTKYRNLGQGWEVVGIGWDLPFISELKHWFEWMDGWLKKWQTKVYVHKYIHKYV